MTDITSKVKKFYRELPFNAYSNPRIAAKQIKQTNQIKNCYPDLHNFLIEKKPKSVLDAGCGAGWLSLTLAYHYRIKTIGIDFNEVAIKLAHETAKELKVNVEFQTVNLLEPLYLNTKFKLICSIGVLHHTSDARQAFANLVQVLEESKNARIYVGLYHKYGRTAFLNYFDELKAEGRSEEELLLRYSELHPLNDKIHLESWFRDQVLHPHETQHTLKEISSWLKENKLELETTSINQFQAVESIEDLYEEEKKLEELSYNRIFMDKSYYPGFYTFCSKFESNCFT